MEIRPSCRVQALGSYAFDEIDRQIATLRTAGVQVSDFGVGDPRAPTPPLIRSAAQDAIDRFATSGYPSYIGSADYRRAVADWTERRFGVALDPDREVCSTAGSKEAVFHFAEGLVDPGELVLVPSPGYPPYERGTLFAEGRFHVYPLREDNGFLPDLTTLPADVLAAARLLWLCHPNAPTGRVLTPEELQDIARFAADHDIVLAADEAYSEIWFGDEAPHSLLEIERDGVIVFQSLSKRSAMTGYRIGWVAGDPRLVEIFKKIKTNIDSGTPNFVQAAAIAALGDEAHVADLREEYREKRDIMAAALAKAGCACSPPEATLYIWQRAPDGYDGLAFARRLLEQDVAVATMPGAWLGSPAADGSVPGEHYVRFALVPTVEETRAAAERLSRLCSS